MADKFTPCSNHSASDDCLPTHDRNEIGGHIGVLVDLRSRLRLPATWSSVWPR